MTTQRSTLRISQHLRTAVLLSATLLPAIGTVNGCAKHTATTKPMEKPQVDPLDTRVQTLREHAEELSILSAQLPGRSTEEHVTLMHNVFDQLAQALPQLYGTDQPGTFRQVVRTLENQRDTLSNGGSNLEPVIDTGLRATVEGLSMLSQQRIYTGAGVAQTIDAAKAQLPELDTTRGPMHQLVVGEIVANINKSVGGMARELTRRAAGEAPSTAEAAPSSAPTTTPDNPAPPDQAKPEEPKAPAAEPAAPAEQAKPAEPAAAAPEKTDKPAETSAPPTAPDENK